MEQQREKRRSVNDLFTIRTDIYKLFKFLKKIFI